MKKALIHIAIRLPTLITVSGALVAIAPKPLTWWACVCFASVASIVADLWIDRWRSA